MLAIVSLSSVKNAILHLLNIRPCILINLYISFILVEDNYKDIKKFIYFYINTLSLSYLIYIFKHINKFKNSITEFS